MFLCRKPLPEFCFYGYKRFEKDERHITRTFQESVLLLVFEGVLRFEEDGNLVEVREGEYYIQRAGLAQSGTRPSDEPGYFYLHMNAFFSESETGGIPLRGKFNKTAIRFYMDEYERLYRSRENSIFALNAVMLQVFAELENSIAPENPRTWIAKDIKRFIASEYRSALSVSRIAERYGYSEDYTIRLFKNEFGITPYQYLIKKRLDEAVHLLLSTTKPVEEISRLVGYNDFSTFYRDFRKRFSMSPSEKRSSEGNG